MSGAIRTIVVDDHPLYRSGVIQILGSEPDIEIVGEGASAGDAQSLVAEKTPDLALLDISMPGDGNAIVPCLRRISPGLRIAMLTASEDNSDVRTALGHGADGYILKGVGGSELLAIVRTLAGGQAYVSPTLAGRLLAQAPVQPAETNRLSDLSRREQEIVKHVAHGMTNKEIARKLDLQEKTVKHYMTTIFQKLDVRNRTEAALLARNIPEILA